jgi:hypothetical protein
MTLCQLYQRLSIEDTIAPGLPAPQVPPLVPISPMYNPPQPVARVSTISSIGSVSPAPTPPRLSYVSSTSTASFPQPKTPTASVEESFAALNVNALQRPSQPAERKSSGSSNSLRRVFNRRPKQEADVSTTSLPRATQTPSHLLPPSHDTASMKSNDWLLKDTESTKTHADQISIASSDQASNAESMYWGPDDVHVNPWAQDRTSPEAPVNRQRVPTSNLEVVPPSQLPPMPVQRVESNKLYLPCEENKFAGFCKGAWKLQIGMKKAMGAEVCWIYRTIRFRAHETIVST